MKKVFATDPDIDQRIRDLIAFAEKFMGHTVHHQMSGENGVVVDWNLGKRLRGVWLITDKGREVYKQWRN